MLKSRGLKVGVIREADDLRLPAETDRLHEAGAEGVACLLYTSLAVVLAVSFAVSLATALAVSLAAFFAVFFASFFPCLLYTSRCV